MSPVQIQILIAAMIVVLALVAAGWLSLAILYRWLGYPPVPDWYREIRLTDEIDTIRKKLQTAVEAGFTVIQHDNDQIVIEKTFLQPTCTMRFEPIRTRLTWQKLSVSCPQHWWLNWSSSVGLNGRHLPRPGTAAKHSRK